MSKPKKRKNVPRIIRRMYTNGCTLDEARKHKIVLDNCMDVEYHWETLVAEAEHDKQPL